MYLVETRNGMRFKAVLAMMQWLLANAPASYRNTNNRRAVTDEFDHLWVLRAEVGHAEVNASTFPKDGRRDFRFAVTDKEIADKLMELWPRDVKCTPLDAAEPR